MSQVSKRQVAGWLAVALSTLLACFWAGWGIIENFHEGWFHDSFLLNVGWMFLQYLSPMIIFLSLTLLAIVFPRIGGTAYALIGVTLALVLFDWTDTVAMQLVIFPMLLLGMLYWYGRPQPRCRAYWPEAWPLAPRNTDWRRLPTGWPTPCWPHAKAPRHRSRSSSGLAVLLYHMVW